MEDQSIRVERRAAEFLKPRLPEIPGGFVGDQRLEPDRQELAWYVRAEPDSPPFCGRQTVKLTLYARSSARRDKERSGAENLLEQLREAVESEGFAADLGGIAAVPSGGGYACDDVFHTAHAVYNIFIRE